MTDLFFRPLDVVPSGAVLLSLPGDGVDATRRPCAFTCVFASRLRRRRCAPATPSVSGSARATFPRQGKEDAPDPARSS